MNATLFIGILFLQISISSIKAQVQSIDLSGKRSHHNAQLCLTNEAMTA